MNLTLLREPSGADTTFGALLIDGFFECWTLENSHKIIPIGTYNVSKYESGHMKDDKGEPLEVPLLFVTGRSYIEIHPANYFHELEGCIAVGRDIWTRPMLSYSRDAFYSLMKKLIFDTELNIKIDYAT